MVATAVTYLRFPPGDQPVEVSLVDLARSTDPESTAAWYLTPREREQYQRLRHPLRRREWLGARVCLKAMLLRRGCVDAPNQCEVVKDAHGRPRISFRPGVPRTSIDDCSLSHKGRFACACVSGVAGAKVGVDIEKVSPRLLKLADAFVSDRDAAIRTRPAEVRLTVLWSLKEACSKALGLGMGIGLANVICQETAEGWHTVRIADGPVGRAWHRMHEGYVIAVCLLRPR